MDIVRRNKTTPFSKGYDTMSCKKRSKVKDVSFGNAIHFFPENDVSHS